MPAVPTGTKSPPGGKPAFMTPVICVPIGKDSVLEAALQTDLQLEGWLDIGITYPEKNCVYWAGLPVL